MTCSSIPISLLDSPFSLSLLSRGLLHLPCFHFTSLCLRLSPFVLCFSSCHPMGLASAYAARILVLSSSLTLSGLFDDIALRSSLSSCLCSLSSPCFPICSLSSRLPCALLPLALHRRSLLEMGVMSRGLMPTPSRHTFLSIHSSFESWLAFSILEPWNPPAISCGFMPCFQWKPSCRRECTIGSSRITFHHFALKELFFAIISSWLTS